MNYDFDISRDEMERHIDQWVLSPRDREIVKRRLLERQKFEPLAEAVGMSVRHVKRIYYRESERVFRHLKK